MSNRPLHDDLQALGAVLDAVPVPSTLRRHVLEAARGPRRSSRTRVWIPIASFALGVALAWWWLPRAVPASPPSEVPPAPVAMTPNPSASPLATPASRDACAVTLSGALAEVAAPCRLRLDEIGVEVEVWADAQLARRDRTIVLLAGAASFDVRPVGDAPPVEVDVGAGRVRVIGTRFEIQNLGPRGHLDLIHGRVEFVDGAEVHEVLPGQRFSWDRRPAEPARAPDLPVPAPRPATPAQRQKPSQPAAAVDLGELLDQVARLRHAGDYDDAERLLLGSMAAVRDPDTLEVLSFELGTLLELHGDDATACAHWRSHLRRFTKGSSRARAGDHLARLDCGD